MLRYLRIRDIEPGNLEKAVILGINVLVQIEGRLIAIQAKRHKSNVGVKALYEVLAGEAWVVINSNFTPQTWTNAKNKPCEADRLR